jgi:hypothetical protein
MKLIDLDSASDFIITIQLASIEQVAVQEKPVLDYPHSLKQF